MAAGEYEEITVNSGITWTYAPASYSFRFTRVGRNVTLSFVLGTATATAATAMQATTIVPASMRPSITTWITSGYMDGTPNGPIAIAVQSSGTMNFYKTTSAGNFANTDTLRTNGSADAVSISWTV